MCIKLVFPHENLWSVLGVGENYLVSDISIKMFKLKVVQTVWCRLSLKGANCNFYKWHDNPRYSAVDLSRQSAHLLSTEVAEDFSSLPGK